MSDASDRALLSAFLLLVLLLSGCSGCDSSPAADDDTATDADSDTDADADGGPDGGAK
jgi:predicted component of type VI protein secretion system